MPMPSDNSFGKRKGSFSPGDELDDGNRSNTPYKPVPLAFQQADATVPVDKMDRNQNRSYGNNRQSSKKRNCCVITTIIIGIIIILAIVLPLAICFGTDLCSNSSTTDSDSSQDNRFRSEIKGTLSTPIISDLGNVPFDDHLLNLTTNNGESTSSILTTAITQSTTENSTASATTAGGRRKRDTTNSGVNNSTDRSAQETYLMDKITEPLLDSVKASSLCREVDCSKLAFEDFRYQNGRLTTRFSTIIYSDNSFTVNPDLISNAISETRRNFSEKFTEIFPGYRLGDIDLKFDAVSFCNYSSVLCYNFTGITDNIPTTTTAILTTTVTETSTITDRSVLLPDLVQIFNRSDLSSSSSSKTSTTTITMPPRVGMADCSRYGWPCRNQKQHISNRQRCDGVVQCSDGSDEEYCEQCRTSFSCPNGDGSWMCLRGSILCDNSIECPTKVDESQLHCKSACLASEYSCRGSKVCIPRQWQCDGDAQCPQGDDELDCNTGRCNHNAFYCKADRKCIPAWLQCNGIPDCSNGDDENNCSCVECSGNSTSLCTGPYGKCIQSKQLCDGKKDCPNGEDEINCKF